MEATRRFLFTLEEARSENGVVMEIGRASRRDPSRLPCVDNLFYDERSLSQRHAQLGLKLMEPVEWERNLTDQFRIYVKDLGSTYGIIDLNSKESDPYIVDLKNGERFGLIQLQHPISMNQCRPAKLKFQVDVEYRGEGVFECLLTDVSFDDSPLATRPATFDERIFFRELENSSPLSYEEECVKQLESSSSSSLASTPCAHEETNENTSWSTEEWSSEEYSRESHCSESHSSEESSSSSFVSFLIESFTKRVEELEYSDRSGRVETSENNSRPEPNRGNESLSSHKGEGFPESSKEEQERPEQQDTNPIRTKRPLSEEDEASDQKQEKHTPPRKKTRFNIVSKRDILTGAIGVVLGSFGTIGILIGIANKLE